MRRVLACVDLSASSEAVADCASSLVDPGGSLVILHVAPPEPDFVGYEVGPRSVREAVAQHLRQEHRDAQRLAERYAERGVDVTPLTVQGGIVERILEHAERLSSELIVVASRGHGVVRDLLVGSVVRGLLKGARVPVVVVPWHPPEG
jgi:nucleotide-binding universal stress UspA family protein